MKSTLYYTYLGVNGSITTSVELEGIYSVKKYFLKADPGKILSKDGINFFDSIYVAEKELPLWKEFDKNGQK